MERLSYAAKTLRKTLPISNSKLPRTKSLPSFFSTPMFLASGKVARPEAVKSIMALLETFPATPNQELLLANCKTLPAGYTHKFERMPSDQYKQTMEETWRKTREEQEKLRREAQEALMNGFLEYRAVAKQVRTRTDLLAFTCHELRTNIVLDSMDCYKVIFHSLHSSLK